MALAVLGLLTPACCCSGLQPPPSPGPAGSISGQILFPPKGKPSPLAVYAINTDRVEAFDTRYVMTRVTPPAQSYQLSVPPGDYLVVARLDSDPLSAAGYLECSTRDCEPVMSRAGYVSCQTIACQPTLKPVRVNAGQGITRADLWDWGSLYALDRLWWLDEAGAPGPFSTYGASAARMTPSPSPQLPVRLLPSPSTQPLSSEFDIPYEYQPNSVAVRLHLPSGWHAIANPARLVDSTAVRDFANQQVRSPLSLDSGGVWLSVDSTYFGCPSTLTAPGGTAQAGLGAGIYYFEDPHSPVGQQPFSGYALLATMASGRECMIFRFTTATDQERESNLSIFVAIVQRAEYVR